jgi:predicted RNA polymerase sigma factor
MIYKRKKKSAPLWKLFYIFCLCQPAVPKIQQINIRFDADTDAELRDTAAALGVSKSALVRRLTEAFLAEVKRTGAVKLKPEWIQDLRAADGRSGGKERKAPVTKER